MTDEWHLYLKAMEAKVTQGMKEQEEHIQQVTQQNTMMIHEQQKKIEELMTTSKSLISKLTRTTQIQESNGNKMGTQQQNKERKRSCATTAKAGYITTVTSVTHWKRTSKTVHHGTAPILIQMGQEKGETKHDGERGPNNVEGTVIAVAT